MFNTFTTIKLPDLNCIGHGINFNNIQFFLYDNISVFFVPPEEMNDKPFFHHKDIRTYPWVAEPHADGSVDRYAEVTLWPLHVQGEVSG